MNQIACWLAASLVGVCVVGCGDEAPSPMSDAAGTSSSGSPGAGSGNGGSGSMAQAGMAASSGGKAASAGAPATGGAGSGGGGNSSGGGEDAASGGEPAGGGGGGGQASGGSGGGGTEGVDVFGIPMLKPSKAGGDSWTSAHWSTGASRTLSGNDPSDPSGWSNRRGDTALMEIDGQGVMSMGGPQPRFYVQPKAGQAKPFFRDIEFTGYYRRTADDGASNAGFVVGIRAHINGHGNDNCNASTYYLVYRNTGRFLFDKELNHPNDSPGDGGQLFTPNGAMPVGKWIGMKYVAYNLPGNQAVRLEAYIDADSNGDGTQPSHWKKLGETTDDGDWDAPVGDCGYPANTVVTEGGGVVFIRNTDVSKVQYQKLSWREITP